MGFVAMTARATCAAAAAAVKEVASCAAIAAAVDLIANSRRSDERAKKEGRTNSVSDFVLGNADVTGKTFMTV